MKINLFINPYEEQNADRRAELDYCIRHNRVNSYINEVYELPGRPTYQQFFDKINEVTTDEDVNVMCNLDIYFDKTIYNATLIKSGDCFALSRWDVTQVEPAVQIKLFNQPGSQDAWIFKGKVRPMKWADFCIGMPGCDNRIAFELQRAGYQVLNPCKDIHAIHYHLTNLHNYDTNDINTDRAVPKPYAFIRPSFLPRVLI